MQKTLRRRREHPEQAGDFEQPYITQTTEQLAAVIHLTIPREKIGEEMGPAFQELMATLGAQGIAPAGPAYSYHFAMPPGDV